MMTMPRWAISATLLCSVGVVRAHAGTRPVPPVCNAMVNAGLETFLSQHRSSGQEADQDNTLVCGTLMRNSYTQHAGHSGHGAHEVLVVSAPTSAGAVLVEVVTNDDLDGKVTGKAGDAVFAYGQAYVDGRPIHASGLTLVGGVHDTHCATHAGADDGWVVVAGKRYPTAGCSRAR